MVGFMRRFDSQFAEARAYVAERGAEVTSIVVESRDPVPACEDMAFVLANSCSHDLDMVNWLFPRARALTVDSAAVTDAGVSGLTIKLTVDTGNSSSNVSAEIRYAKCHPTYLQLVHVHCGADDVRTFGYDHTPAGSGVPFCALYEDAYKRQFAAFVDLAAGRVDRSDDLLHSYARTFDAMDAAIAGLAI